MVAKTMTRLLLFSFVVAGCASAPREAPHVALPRADEVLPRADVIHSRSDASETLVRRLFDEALNQGQFDAVPDLVAEGYVQHNPLVPQGRDGFLVGLSAFRAAFPDYASTIEDVAVSGDRVWVRHTARGTFRGAYLGIEPTGRSFEISVADVFQVQEGPDGRLRLAEHWDVFPFLDLLAQVAPDAALAQIQSRR